MIRWREIGTVRQVDEAPKWGDNPTVAVGYLGHRVGVHHGYDWFTGGGRDRCVDCDVHHGEVTVDVGDGADVDMDDFLRY